MGLIEECNWTDATATDRGAVWDPNFAVNDSYVDGKTIEAQINKIIIKMVMNTKENTLTVSYRNDRSSEIYLVSNNNNEGYNDNGGYDIQTWKDAIISDLKEAQYGFYIVSSLWKPEEVGITWYACQYNGLTDKGYTNYGNGISSITLKTLTGAELYQSTTY